MDSLAYFFICMVSSIFFNYFGVITKQIVCCRPLLTGLTLEKHIEAHAIFYEVTTI